MAAVTLSGIRQDLSNFDFRVWVSRYCLIDNNYVGAYPPPVLLDILFTFNIVVGLVIIMIAVNISDL